MTNTRHPDRIVSQIAKAMRLLREAGLPDDFYQRVIDDPKFRERTAGFVLSEISQLNHLDRVNANSIMGRNYIGPDRIEDFLASPLATEFGKIPFSEDLLRRVANTHVLIADTGLSIAGLIDLQHRNVISSRTMSASDQAWFRHENFAMRTAQPCWRLVCKSVPEGATGQDWAKQKRMYTTEALYILRARETLYFSSLYFFMMSERLFSGYLIRTTDINDKEHRQICLYSYGAEGVPNIVYSDEPTARESGVVIGCKPSLVVS